MVQAHSVRMNFGVPCVVLAWRMPMYFASKMSPQPPSSSFNFPIPSAHVATMSNEEPVCKDDPKKPRPTTCFCLSQRLHCFFDVGHWRSFHVSNHCRWPKFTKSWLLCWMRDCLRLHVVVTVRECQSMSKRRNMSCTCTVFNGTAAVGTASVEWCWMYNIYIMYCNLVTAVSTVSMSYGWGHQ